MKEIRKLPASAGAQWLLDTFSLYRRAPLQLARIGLTWLLVSWVVTLLSTLIPGAAGMAVQLMTLAISPIMFGGMLYAVGEIDEGRPGLASHLLQPIRDHRVSHLLVPLAIQVLAVLLLGALLFMMIGREGFTAFSEVMTKMEEISRSGQQIKPDDAAALVANLPAKRIALWMLLVFLSAVALSLAMFTQRRLHRPPRRLRPQHRACGQCRTAGPPAVAPLRPPGAAVFSPAGGKTGIIGGTGSRPAPSCPSRMSMKEIRKLPASAGAQWLLDTFSLYRRAPLQLARIGLTWLLVSWVVTLLSTLIPGAAGMAVQLMTLAISPIMFGGMLYAVGEIDEGRPGLASHLLQPIRDHRVSHLLVPLAIQVLAVLLLGALLFMMIGREGFTAFSEVMTKMEEISRSGQQIKPDDAAALVANLPAKRIALWMLLVFLSAVALSLAMFTQPALVVFDKQSGMHALRLSLQGCIENIGAMFVFAVLGLIAAFCMYILFVIVIQIAMLIGGPLAAAFIAQLVLTTVLMPLYVGAVYAAWKQMFVHRGSRAAPPIPTTPTSSDVFHA